MSRSPTHETAAKSSPLDGGDHAVPGVAAVVMAAGLGKRMESKYAKVLHPVAGRPMVLYSVDLALRVAGDHVAVVVGHQAERVAQVIKQATAGGNGHVPVSIVEQRELLGTGHAVLQTRPVFAESGRPLPSQFVIVNGDTPLLQEKTLRGLLEVHRRQEAAVTVLTAVLDDASGYGRVVRSSPDDGVSRIVEDRDADAAVKTIREINVGTYVVEGDFLFAALEELDPANAQGEFYLTDIVQAAVAKGRRVAAVPLEDPDEGLGVNTRAQLADAEQVVRRQIRRRWLDAGVRMIDPASTWIDAGVRIGRDSVLYPQVALEGATVIGEDVVIRSGSRITDCIIGNRVEVLDHCICRESQIEDDATVGPFAHLRPHVVVRKGAKIGNFVEAKKTELGEGSKASHLSYLGDAKIGKGVNIGAGTITCNYDGVRKAETIIEDRVFIGSDTQLVAPVTVGAGSVVAAGTTVTENVPLDSLVISRVMQVTRPGWAARRRALLADGDRPATAKSRAKSGKKTSSRRKGKAPKGRSR